MREREDARALKARLLRNSCLAEPDCLDEVTPAQWDVYTEGTVGCSDRECSNLCTVSNFGKCGAPRSPTFVTTMPPAVCETLKHVKRSLST